ncbi:MAG TPA: tRNA uracil 4-sulfurtransferase ThiI [Mariprofundaceae bacterium]|nr:tRNA uracil 4-sulfurtransferase ThiI [Mariprofundaceae bacterium]
MPYILVHYGELSLKGKNRSHFERKLAANLKRLLKPVRVERRHSRMLMEVERLDAALLDRVALIPGIRNFAPVHQAGRSIESMQQVAKEAVTGTYGDVAGRSFCVTTRRGDKKFPMTSPEINYEVGGCLKNELGLVVNLDRPEITVHVEITPDEAYIYTDKRPGVGGLPVGTSGRGVVLFSGGIDSPVAAYTMMKRGLDVVLVHCYNSTINRDFAKIEDLARQLSRYQGRLKLHMVDLEEFQRHVIATVPADYRMIIYKRQMIREAAKIATGAKGQALITGDSLGQVASQTLANIQAIYEASPLPLLSPLIGYDKEEIIALGRRIGTFDISVEEYCDICSFLIAKHPQTKGKLADVNRLEAALPIRQIESPVRTKLFFAGEDG